MASQRTLSSGLVALALLLLPLAVWFEKTEASVWQDRLWLPSLTEEPNLHTPIFTDGQFLPTTISESITLTPEAGVVIIPKTTTIPAGVTVTVAPGTRIVAHEFAQLRVEGTLNLLGTADEPITLTTNEAHSLNKLWMGILFEAGGRGVISHTSISYASPGVSCVTGSSVTIDHAKIANGTVGVYTETDRCTVANSRIHSVSNGLVVVASDPPITNTSISAQRNDVLYAKVNKVPEHLVPNPALVPVSIPTTQN